MKLLIKTRPNPTLTAHIPDSSGSAFCHQWLTRADWHIKDRISTGLVICHACKRAQAKIDNSR
jgi:hypothetical protein